MEGKKTWSLMSIILGIGLLFPLSVSLGSEKITREDRLLEKRDLTTNKSANDKATIKYEYRRLVGLYLYNDGHIDPQEQTVLKLLEGKWQISPQEVEEILQEAKKSIR